MPKWFGILFHTILTLGILATLYNTWGVFGLIVGLSIAIGAHNHHIATLMEKKNA